MADDIKLPETDWWAVFHGAALYGIYSRPADAQSAIDVVPKTRGPVAFYTADQVRAAVLADREGRQEVPVSPDTARLASLVRRMILDGDLTDWSDACDRLILDAIAVYVAPPAAAQRAKEE